MAAMKVLIIDDGKPHRAEKAKMYALLAQMMDKSAVVTREQLQQLSAQSLQGQDVIITDLEGQLRTNPDNTFFFTLLTEAVQSGAKPKVHMFSGAFRGDAHKDIDLSGAPALEGMIATHNATDALGVIKQAVSVKDTGVVKEEARRGTILVVDEYQPTLDEIKRVLEDEGHNVLTAQSPLEAVDVWKEHRKDVDMVLTQRVINRDELAGVKLTQRLRALGAEIPVVMQSDITPTKSESDMFLHAGGTKSLPTVSLSLMLDTVKEQLASSTRGR
jgi:CheY-like chemotaxis protein